MDSNEIPEIELYSDGGAEPNPGRGGFGVILSYKGHRKEFSQGYTLTTNNRMELMGVIYGLERLKTKSIVTVFTDSKYVIDGVTKGWAEKWKSKNWFRTPTKKAVNYDLWDKLLKLVSQNQEVKFIWVKGHAGHIENERCDQLALLALKGESLLEDTGYLPLDQLDENDINSGVPKNISSNKIVNEGDCCRKCDTKVIKRPTKKHNFKPNQTYYFDYHLYCPGCKTMYMIEEAKRKIENNDLGLFS